MSTTQPHAEITHFRWCGLWRGARIPFGSDRPMTIPHCGNSCSAPEWSAFRELVTATHLAFPCITEKLCRPRPDSWGGPSCSSMRRRRTASSLVPALVPTQRAHSVHHLRIVSAFNASHCAHCCTARLAHCLPALWVQFGCLLMRTRYTCRRRRMTSSGPLTHDHFGVAVHRTSDNAAFYPSPRSVQLQQCSMCRISINANPPHKLRGVSAFRWIALRNQICWYHDESISTHSYR